MCWIDYRKAFDIIPYYWLLKCLDMFKVALNVKGFIARSVISWQADLMAGNVHLGNVKIKRLFFKMIVYRHYYV